MLLLLLLVLLILLLLLLVGGLVALYAFGCWTAIFWVAGVNDGYYARILAYSDGEYTYTLASFWIGILIGIGTTYIGVYYMRDGLKLIGCNTGNT